MFTRIKESLYPKKKELREDVDVNLEKGDITALIVAAMTTIIPVVLVLLALFYGVMWFIFLR